LQLRKGGQDVVDGLDNVRARLAPGRLAETCMTGNSTSGSGATGRKSKASAPDNSSAAANNKVPMGRLMKGAEMFMQLVQRRPEEVHAGS
jgi:hypothetical protein